MNNLNNKWDFRFIDIAKSVSNWSKDTSTQVGAVIVGENSQIISQGYNGFPRGVNDTKERYDNREIKYKFVVHAEANAIYNALSSGSNIENSTIFVSGLPVCNECAKAIIQCGIKRVVMDTSINNTRWKESTECALLMFDEANVEYIFLGD